MLVAKKIAIENLERASNSKTEVWRIERNIKIEWKKYKKCTKVINIEFVKINFYLFSHWSPSVVIKHIAGLISNGAIISKYQDEEINSQKIVRVKDR